MGKCIIKRVTSSMFISRGFEENMTDTPMSQGMK